MFQHHFIKIEDIPKPNIDYVLSATKSIAPFIKSGDLIILESTSPVGTTEKIQQTLIDCGANLRRCAYSLLSRASFTRKNYD